MTDQQRNDAGFRELNEFLMAEMVHAMHRAEGDMHAFLESLKGLPSIDKLWLSLARMSFREGFLCLTWAITGGDGHKQRRYGDELDDRGGGGGAVGGAGGAGVRGAAGAGGE